MGFYLTAALGLFGLTIATGVWLSKSGRPLKPLPAMLHKLIALGAVVFGVLALLQGASRAALAGTILPLKIVTAALAVLLFATGTVLSREKPQPAVMLALHRVGTLLTMIFIALVLWRLKG